MQNAFVFQILLLRQDAVISNCWKRKAIHIYNNLPSDLEGICCIKPCPFRHIPGQPLIQIVPGRAGEAGGFPGTRRHTAGMLDLSAEHSFRVCILNFLSQISGKILRKNPKMHTLVKRSCLSSKRKFAK